MGGPRARRRATSIDRFRRAEPREISLAGGGETKDAKKSRKESLGADAPRKKKKAKKARRLPADPFAAAEQEAGANGRKVLCSMTGTIKGHHGLEFKYGAALTGVWAYRQEHLETTHALKRAAGAIPRNRDRARECPPAPRFTMTVLEKEPGTLVCQGTFTDDPALWGHGAAPARSRGRLEPAEPAEAPLFTPRPESHRPAQARTAATRSSSPSAPTAARAPAASARPANSPARPPGTTARARAGDDAPPRDERTRVPRTAGSRARASRTTATTTSRARSRARPATRTRSSA